MASLKTACMRRVSVLLFYFSGLLVFAVFSIFSVSAETLNVSANILSGTCDVSLAKGENMGAGGDSVQMELQPVSPAQLRTGGVWNLSPVTLIINGCRGTIAANELAAFSVTGPTVAGSNILFNNLAPTGAGEPGIVLSTVSENEVHEAWNEDNYLQKGTSYYRSSSPGARIPVGMTHTIPLWVGVSCGSGACIAGLSNRNIKADMTFTFTYQ